MKFGYFDFNVKFLARLCFVLSVLLMASCQQPSPQKNAPSARKVPGEMQVIFETEGRVLPRPIPIYSKAKLVSAHLVVLEDGTNSFVITLVVGEMDMKGLLSFYDGVFWDRQSSGSFRDIASKNYLPALTEPYYAVLYWFADDDLLIGLSAVKLELGPVRSKIDKPIQVTISEFPIEYHGMRL